MAWKDLKSELEEMFSELSPETLDFVRLKYGENLTVTSDTPYWQAQRIKRYLATPKGKEALKRYEQSEKRKTRRNERQRLARKANPARNEALNAERRARYAARKEAV